MKLWNFVKIICYGLAMVAIAIGIKDKVQDLIVSRDTKIAQFVEEYAKHGIPVTTYEVTTGRTSFTQPITIHPRGKDKAITYVDDKVKALVKIGDQVKVFHESQTFSGRVTKIAERVDYNTGLFPVAIRMDQPLSDAVSWYPADLKIKNRYSGISIPAEIVAESGKQKFVWKIIDGKASRQPITPVFTNGQTIVVQSGIADADLLIKSKSERITEGVSVRIYSEEGVAP